MICTPATKYQRLTVGFPGTQIESGLPIIVHGILFRGLTGGSNAQLIGYKNNDISQVNQLFNIYVTDSGFALSFQMCGPILADKGFSLAGVAPFTTNVSAPIDVVIFYSHIGG